VIGAATTEFLVRQNLVESRGRPGGNVTGFTISTGAEIYGKRVGLLAETIPNLTRVVVVWNPSNEGARASLPAIETATRALGAQVESIAASDIEELGRRLSGSVRRSGDQGLPRRQASVPGRHNHRPACLELRPVGGKRQSLWPRPIFRGRATQERGAVHGQGLEKIRLDRRLGVCSI
jgi:ABC transporter substrate binding protein